jgi:hypothetical protein
MAPKLTPEEIVTLQVLKLKGQSNAAIAHTLGVTEGAVRYHLRRQGQEDGRKDKPRKAAPWEHAIADWVKREGGGGGGAGGVRRLNILALYDWLRAEYGYVGSYKSVWRFVRARYPGPRLRPFRRVETPPGAQVQVDWGTFADIDVGDGPEA